MQRDAVDLIETFNAGRDPERLALKYRAMAADPFAFLRGSCHLFYQDYATSGPDLATPAVWICGDLHLENFGSYLGDNRHAYFNLNDFGESILAPAHWELSRFLVSVWVAAGTLGLKPDESLQLCKTFLSHYGESMSKGSPHPVDQDSAKGMVRDLLRNVRKRDGTEYLDARTQVVNGRRALQLDGKKALPISEADRTRVERLIAQHAEAQANPGYFQLLDVARRIAGTGSLGIERFVVLVRGDGKQGNPSLLDLRLEPGSALTPYVRLKQPSWRNEAARVVTVQRRMQVDTPAFLAVLSLDQKSYVLRELLPSQDRLSLKNWDGKLGRLDRVMQTMGTILASAQLRSCAWKGAAEIAELVDFSSKLQTYRCALLGHARFYAEQVFHDWRQFAAAYPDAPLQQH